MPNWVFNSLVVSGDKATLDEMVAQLNKPVTKQYFDFVYESESPRKVKMDENGNAIREQITTVYNNPVFSFWNVVAPTDLEAYYGEEVFKNVNTDNPDGTMNNEKFMAEFVRSMSEDNDWYHWNCRNWGTKWDIAVADNQEYSDTTMEWSDSGDVVYRFQTAWSPVGQLLTQLSEMYPTLTFNYEYEEEQGWGGISEYNDGEESIIDEWDIPSSHADYVKLDRECACEWGDIDYAFEDCPVDTTKYVWDETEWVEKESVEA